MDLVDRIWYQANPDPTVSNDDARARPRRKPTDWALRFDLEMLKPNKGGLDFDEGLSRFQGEHLADRLSMSDTTRQVIIGSPTVRAALAKEIRDLDRAGEVGGLREVAEGLLDCDPRAGEKFGRCHDIETYALGFHVHTDEGGQEEITVKHQRDRCWLRICPKCARDISARLRVRYAARLAAVELHRPRGFGFRHLTLTMRRGDGGRDLRADLDFIHKATKKLVHRFWTKADHRAGAFATVELGPQGGNVHVHAMIWGARVPQADISAYWEKLTGNPVIDIRIKTKEQVIGECLKYITKLAKSEDGMEFTLSTSDLVALHLALKGKRRVWTFGSLYGMAEDECAAEADDERDPGRCDECKTPMLWARLAELRELLGLSRPVHLKHEINCSNLAPSPGAAVLQGASGLACAPPGASLARRAMGYE